MQNCPNCGTPGKSAAQNFCENCGSPLPSVEKPVQPANANIPQQVQAVNPAQQPAPINRGNPVPGSTQQQSPIHTAAPIPPNTQQPGRIAPGAVPQPSPQPSPQPGAPVFVPVQINQGHPNPINQGPVQQPGMSNQGLPQQPTPAGQGFPQHPGRPNQGFPQQPAMPNQGVPQQPGIPNQGVPQQPSGPANTQQPAGAPNAQQPAQPTQPATVEAVYMLSEQQMFQQIIDNELKALGIDEKAPIQGATRQKNIAAAIFSFLLFALGCMIFLRFFKFAIALAVIILIYRKYYKRFTKYSYIIKQLKTRPDEKIPYVIASCAKPVKSKISPTLIRTMIFILPLILLVITFWKPHAFYEEVDGGYGLRYYTSSVIPEKDIVIPDYYNGKPVVSLRGEVFKDLFTAETIQVPETVTEIRGQAFQNCRKLRQVNIPHGITEIKAETYRDCRALESIEIPDGVTRIGAHAFRNCDSLTEVYCPDSVESIGRSAFRECDSLQTVSIPSTVSLDEKVFSETSADVNYR